MNELKGWYLRCSGCTNNVCVLDSVGSSGLSKVYIKFVQYGVRCTGCALSNLQFTGCTLSYVQ